MRKIVVIGGGAAGMMASIFASKKNNEVFLIEKNEKLGKKIYITGKGRCNLTNNCSCEDFIKNVVSNQKFLYSAIYNFSPEDTMNFFEKYGLNLTVERGNRVFPSTQKASDVTKTLSKIIEKNAVHVELNTYVKDILTENNKIVGVVTNNQKIQCDSVIIATGGISYPLTGSTGDGYAFARKLGINVVNCVPSLVGFDIKEDMSSLAGLSLKNVSFTIKRGEKKIFTEFGEMLFTHTGVSGPIVLTSSAIINREDLSNLTFFIDFKPALTVDILEKRLIREFSENNLKDIVNVMPSLVPKSLIPFILSKSKISCKKKCAEITQEERKNLVKTLKEFSLKPKNLRPIDEAIVTAGGIDIKEINPKTMQSNKISGLFFAGEVIDVDALTGGFNLQIAFSTGKLAGENA